MEQKITKASAVKLDSITAMKLMKMSNECPNQNQYGYLLGIIDEETIQVTNCYPILSELDNDQQDKYDQEMLEYARKNHLDNNKVGLFIISDSYKQFSLDQFEELSNLQFYIRYAFILTYSPQLAKSGNPQPFLANIINEKYIDLHLRDDVTLQDLQTIDLKYDKLYRTLPVELTKTPLCQAFLYQYRKDIQEKYQKIDTEFQTNLVNLSKNMIETLDSAYNACDKLNNFEKKDKKESIEKTIQTNELIDYLIHKNKIQYLAENLRKETQFIIETDQLAQSILK